MALASPAAELMKIAEALNKPSTVDIDVKSWNFSHSHGVLPVSPSYFVEMQLGERRKQTSASNKKVKTPNWNMVFVFAADLSTRLIIRVYCRHGQGGKGDHVIGETTLNLLKTARNENIDIDVYDPTKGTAKTGRGHLTLCLRVSRPTIFTLPNEAFSALDLQAIPQDVIRLLSLEQVQTQNLSPAWKQFLPAFYNVVSRAAHLLNVHPCSQVAIAAVAFAVKAVIDQIVRDEKIERLIQIIGDLYIYFLDAVSIQKILSYKTTMERLLTQTSECAYFIANYRQVKLFAQRAIVDMVSGADIMIAQMENAFCELKIELLLGSSLQTVVVSCRILEKVENIENLMYINQLPYSKGASWDSGRACLPGTRQDIINDIVSWTINQTETQQSRLYVLRGPLGCGKSSIAHTIAEIFHQQNRLGAAVFLDGCVDQKVNSQTVTSTIAFQLAGYDAIIGQRIAEIIKGNPTLASANIERQLPELIGAATKDLAMIGPVVIVVDGLIDPQEQHRLLTAIANSSSSFPANFRFVVTSRYKLAEGKEDWSIRDIGFEDSGDGTLDIGKYTYQCLHQLLSVKPKLFQQRTVEELSRLLIPRALGMHYWVTTAYRLLLSSCDGNDCLILDKILSSSPPFSKQEAMDHVYRAVLHVLHDSAIPLPVPANAIFHVLIQSSPIFSQPSLQNSRFVPPKRTRSPLQILEELDGIIETGLDQQSLPLFRLQPDFGIFMIDPQRCGTTGFHVDGRLPVTYSLAELCLDEMNHALAHNLCQLDDLMLLDKEILDKEDRIRQFIPGTLRYACCQWISHLELAKDVKAVIPKIETFLFSHLLHWFEVMSILGYFQLIIPSLERLAAWFKKHHMADTRRHIITTDGIQFIRAFYPIISKASMQIYISALPLMSSDTLLFETYHTEAIPGRSDLRSHTPSGWATLNTPAEWDPTLHLDTNTLSGYLIAKVECYPTNSVHLYDCRTDNKVGTSLQLQLPAKSTHFSPDKRHILTVDDNGAIRIWDVEKRSLVDYIKSNFRQPLIHHSARGNRILVGGREANGFGYKFSVWNTATAKFIREFAFNISYWHNIALSPDGTKLAVQERNKTGVLFFHVESGELIDQPFGAIEGIVPDSLSLTKLIWSSKDDLLAFVSRQDASIRLWTPDRRTSMLLPKSGSHGSHVSLSCLAFSPDNSCIAALYSYSKSNSEQVRIWDTQTGKIIWSEKLPPGVYSMSFHPDSQEILFIEVELNKPPIRIVRLPVRMSYPPRIYKWTSAFFIQYSHLTSSTNVDFTSKVDGDGWVINTAGERQMWVPYPGFELRSQDRNESDGQQATFSQRKTLEVKIPGTDVVILRFKIDFKLQNE